MIVFNDLDRALEEAEWCAASERVIYYVFPVGEKYVVRKKHGGNPKPKRRHIEVGFKHRKRGRKPEV
jgi:hypothetical protein